MSTPNPFTEGQDFTPSAPPTDSGTLPEVTVSAKKPTPGVDPGLFDALEGTNFTPDQIKATRTDLMDATAGLKRTEQKEEASADEKFTGAAPMDPGKDLMQRMSPLLLFAAFGGSKSKAMAGTMLAATSGTIKGFLEGNEEAYKDSVTKYNEAFAAFKEHQEQQSKIYTQMREAYKGRVDADIKALQFARQITGDEVKSQVNMMMLFERQNEALARLTQSQKVHEDLETQRSFDNSFKMRKLADAEKLAGGASKLPPKTIDLLASQYLIDRKLPTFSRAAGGDANRVAVLTRASQIAEANGDDAASLAAKQAAIKSAQSALTDQGKKGAAMGQSEKTAMYNLQMAVDLGKKTDRTGSPLINRGIIDWRTGVTGDPDTKSFVNALTTAKDEYAKVVSGATGAAGITDAARKESDQLFSRIDSQASLEQVIGVAKQEMANRIKGYAAESDALKRSISENVDVSTPGAAGPAAAPKVKPPTATGSNGEKIWYDGKAWKTGDPPGG